MRRKRVNPKIKIYKRRAAAVFTIVLIILCLGLIFDYVTREEEEVEFVDEDRPADFDPNYPLGRPEKLVDQTLFRAAFIRGHGGREAIDALRSIRMAGEIIEPDGQSKSFLAVKQRPSKLLMTFSQGNYDITFGVDSGDIWQRVSIPNRDPIFPEVEEEQKAQIREIAQFLNPVAQVLIEERGQIEKIEHQEIDGEEWIIARIRAHSFEHPIIVHLDIKELLPRKLQQVTADGAVFRTIEISDYRKVAGVPIPHEMVTYADGELINSTHISRVSANVGIMSVAFQRPEDLSVPKVIPPLQ